jgi:hypothetical protein
MKRSLSETHVAYSVIIVKFILWYMLATFTFNQFAFMWTLFVADIFHYGMPVTTCAFAVWIAVVFAHPLCKTESVTSTSIAEIFTFRHLYLEWVNFDCPGRTVLYMSTQRHSKLRIIIQPCLLANQIIH